MNRDKHLIRYGRTAQDEAARQRRIEAMMPLVKRIGWHVFARVGKAVDLDDLVQAGMLGLVEAAQRGVEVPDEEFTTYATPRIRGAMIDLVRRHAHLSRITVERKKKIRAARKAVEMRGGAASSSAAVAAEIGIDVKELAAWEEDNAAQSVESLDQLMDNYGLWIADETLSPHVESERRQLLTLLSTALGTLPERLQLVLQLYYVEELNLKEIAAIIDVSIGRVSQLKSEATQLIARRLGHHTGSVAGAPA